MSIFFPAKKSSPTTGSSSAGVPSYRGGSSEHGLITKRELHKDVMAYLRRRGVSAHDRKVIEAVASGHLDKNGGAVGIDYHETEGIIDTLAHNPQELGLSKTEIKKSREAFDDALKN